MGSRRGLSRAGGAAYLAVIFTALMLIGLVAGFLLQLDQQTARARMIRGMIDASFLARHGIENAARELGSTGSLSSRNLTLDAGTVEVVVEGPRPAGSRCYIVFSRGRANRTGVLMIADLKYGSPKVDVANLQVLYQDLDPAASTVRNRLITERARALKTLIDNLQAYKTEGAGLKTRLDAFLSSTMDRQIPARDRAIVSTQVPTILTTAAP